MAASDLSAAGRSRRRSLSLVEAVASMALVGLTLVVSLNALGASRLSLWKMGDRARGQLLAEGLMAEILQTEYLDPDGSPVFGLESGESTGTRTAFDDVDDYDGWSESPPQYRDGTALPETTAWSREVAVVYADPNGFGATLGFDLGVKKITVEVMHNGATAASLTAVKTSADATVTEVFDMGWRMMTE